MYRNRPLSIFNYYFLPKAGIIALYCFLPYQSLCSCNCLFSIFQNYSSLRIVHSWCSNDDENRYQSLLYYNLLLHVHYGRYHLLRLCNSMHHWQMIFLFPKINSTSFFYYRFLHSCHPNSRRTSPC